jgi:site-specific DNA-cytosine methylase
VTDLTAVSLFAGIGGIDLALQRAGECERLQGFPDDWTAGQADAPRYRQLGNTVAVPCIEWVTRRVVATDSRQVTA